MGKPTKAELARRFSHAAPTPERAAKHRRVNDVCLSVAEIFTELLPDGRNLALTLTALEDVRMRANAALAQDERPDPLAGDAR